jgi:hypothetical protein
MTFEEMEEALRQRLEALLPAARAELIHEPRSTLLDGTDPLLRIGTAHHKMPLSRLSV